MIRAVLDTNVYVAALLSAQGSPARIVRALSEGLFDAVVCPRLLDELSGVLDRPKIASRVAADDRREFVQWLTRVAVLEPDPAEVAPRSPDPDDDYILALAIESETTAVVSGDAHLLQMASDVPRVLAPATFAALLDALR